MAGSKGKKDGKKDDELRSIPVEVSSLADLARNVVTFGERVRPLFAFKEGNKYRLAAPSVKLGDARLLFYYDVAGKTVGNGLLYRPGSGSVNEAIEFADRQPAGPQLDGIQFIPIMEMLKSPFGAGKATTKIESLGMRNYAQLVKAVIAKGMDNEIIGKVYVFKHGPKYYAGAFGIMDEDEIHALCYAELDTKERFGFFRYDYNADAVEPTNMFGDHSYVYARVVNLAEEFPFFKPD